MTRASDLAKLLGAGATILDGTTISTADNTEQLTLTSTDADANAGPELLLDRNSSSPADADRVGKLTFKGRNDANQTVEYGNVQSRIIDASDGTEDGRIIIQNIIAGDVAGVMESNGTETIFNENSKDLDFRVESNGNANMLFVDGGTDAVIIGHNASRQTLFNTNGTAALQIEGTSANTAAMSIARNSNDDNGPQLVLAKSNGTSGAAVTVVTDDALLGRISFQGADGSQTVEAARIEGFVDGTPGANDMPGRLTFSTTADGASTTTERVRIDSIGEVLFGTTSRPSASVGGASFEPAGDSRMILNLGCQTSANRNVAVFRNTNNAVGTISLSGTSTAYNTSSDHRLKNNVTADWDATTRLKQLNPVRFNFIADADTTVDGFLAHEVQSVVPEAITGTHNEVDDDGNPVYQGIDQSKLVPLLVKTIQELEARITALENA